MRTLFVHMCGTDEPTLGPVFKANFLFYPPINKLAYKFNRFLQPILKLKARMKKAPISKPFFKFQKKKKINK